MQIRARDTVVARMQPSGQGVKAGCLFSPASHLLPPSVHHPECYGRKRTRDSGTVLHDLNSFRFMPALTHLFMFYLVIYNLVPPFILKVNCHRCGQWEALRMFLGPFDSTPSFFGPFPTSLQGIFSSSCGFPTPTFLYSKISPKLLHSFESRMVPKNMHQEKAISTKKADICIHIISLSI